MQSLQKISIAKKDDRVFFHVIGDNTEYMDLDSILGRHAAHCAAVPLRCFQPSFQDLLRYEGPHSVLHENIVRSRTALQPGVD